MLKHRLAVASRTTLAPYIPKLKHWVLRGIHISKQTKHVPVYKFSGANQAEWAVSRKLGLTNDTLEEHISEHKRFKKEAKKQEEKQARSKEDQHQIWLQSPEGQVALKKQRLTKLNAELDVVFDSLERLEISEFPESLRRLTSLISAIENKMEEAFPDHVKKTKVNPFIAENIELRRQLQEQQRKIESLERALSSKQASTKGLPQAAALSSSEIELMAN